MAREIKKPTQVRESDLKEYAGEVVLDSNEAANKQEAKKNQQAVTQDAAAEAVAVAAVQAASVPGVRLLSFNAWFQKASARNPRVKLSYKEAIEAHCKAVGLESQATEETFDAALSHFGL